MIYAQLILECISNEDKDFLLFQQSSQIKTLSFYIILITMWQIPVIVENANKYNLADCITSWLYLLSAMLRYKHPAKSCCLIWEGLLQLVTNLLSNYSNRAGLGESEALQSLIQHLLFCISVHSINTALQGATYTTICFFITFAHSNVMLAQTTTFILSEVQIYICSVTMWLWI